MQNDEGTKKVAVLELRRLLTELKEHRPDIYIRYRLMGQMWAEKFLRVVAVSDRGVILHDEESSKQVTIPDLSKVMQFELDKSFQTYQPHNHFDVVVNDEWV